jgi:hypothetical protein
MRETIGNSRSCLLGVAGAVLLLASSTGPVHAQRRVVQHIRGQNVAPVFDGYEINPDGTYSLWFGYFSRNQEEFVEVPVGENNRFEPGPADRGQPTHFVPEWQKSAFRVTVPKDFGNQKLTWWLTSNGKTESVVANLNPFSIIDRQKTTIEGATGENLAPVVTLTPTVKSLARSEKLTLKVSATDDGKPLNPRTQKPEDMSVRWRKYRGPVNGKVTFSPSASRLVNGTATSDVTFSAPGEYILQAVVDDGSLFVGTYCCWVNTEAKITVR